jgi:maltose alpha-D-glucosyltransferase/alpha-amylase
MSDLKKTYWWKEAKIYELYIDKFADTIENLTLHLDYFTTLGVNTLHLLPHYPSPMVDDGYDVSDYRNVRASLGSLDDFSAFVDEAHSRGIRIVTDLVLNHTSNTHEWFKEAVSSKHNSKRNYYLWSETGTEFPGALSGLPDIKQNNWIRNEATHDFYYATYYPQQPDLNWDNPAVFEEMLAIMEFWAALGVDGFRLDAVPHLIKREGTTSSGLPETHAVIKRIRSRLESQYPQVILIAEAADTLAETKKYFGAGDECHMAYHFILMEEMWSAIRRGDTTRLAGIVQDSLDIPDNCQWAIFLRNHDEIALGSLEPDEHAALLDFLDSERAYAFGGGTRTSMRIGSIFKGDRSKILDALSLLYSLPGAPIMYYGDEIGMNNLAVEAGIRDSRKYVRGVFDWDHARQQIKDPESLFSAVSKLLRTGNAAVVHTEEHTHDSDRQEQNPA